jgi:hypothetical protein
MVVAVVLVIGGTLATGLLPSEPRYQAVAGAIIVAGFAAPVVCFGREIVETRAE